MVDQVKRQLEEEALVHTTGHQAELNFCMTE